ncbi:MAG: thymidine phosphorylase [Chloroflexi bacterium]|nr:thymidine phosphorylase [Chloroflexota bacterium]
MPSLSTVEIIERTKRGQGLGAENLHALIQGYLKGEIPDYQISAWLMAVCWRGLSPTDTFSLTQALVESGTRLRLRDRGIVAVDKHSTGGVGDKITLVLVPIVAACGLAVAKMSGRGLGFTGGTLDKLEAIPGLRTALSIDEFIAQVCHTGLVIAGQTADLAPGDGKLYAVRDVTGTIDSLHLIAASVMSKKIAVGASTLLLDIKFGNGAFMSDQESAQALASLMLAIAQRAGMTASAVLTSMEQPLGRAIGNAIEVAEAIDVLKGSGPKDLQYLARQLSAELLHVAGQAPTREAALPLIEQAINSGGALQRLSDLIEAQGGDSRVLHDPSRLPQAAISRVVPAPRTGYVAAINARALGYAAVTLGAGRQKKGDPIDPSAGILLAAKAGDALSAGDPLATIFAADTARAAAVFERVQDAYMLTTDPVPEPSLIEGMLG